MWARFSSVRVTWGGGEAEYPYVLVNTSCRQAMPVKSFAANPDELALPPQVKGPAVAVEAAITEYENPDVIFSKHLAFYDSSRLMESRL
jgi:hypothetical protein